MQFEYSEEEDALYVYFQKAAVSRSRDVDEGIIVDYDARGDVVGIEVLDASSRVAAGGGARLVRRMLNQDSARVLSGGEE